MYENDLKDLVYNKTQLHMIIFIHFLKYNGIILKKLASAITFRGMLKFKMMPELYMIKEQ